MFLFFIYKIDMTVVVCVFMLPCYSSVSVHTVPSPTFILQKLKINYLILFKEEKLGKKRRVELFTFSFSKSLWTSLSLSIISLFFRLLLVYNLNASCNGVRAFLDSYPKFVVSILPSLSLSRKRHFFFPSLSLCPS